MTRNLTTIGALAFVLAAGQVNAQALKVQVPQDVEPARSQLTHTEVLADLHLYRLAGMYEFTRGINVFDAYSYPYRKRNATYQQLRQSPQYAELVKELERNPNAQVMGARTLAPIAMVPN